MRQTLLKIQELLDDIQGDVTLLKLTILANKVERVRQLFEGVIHDHKVEVEFKRAFKIGQKDET